VPRTWLAQVLLRINGFQSHLPHQTLDPLLIHRSLQLLVQKDFHLPNPVERRARVLLVDQTHDLEVVRIFRPRLVVKARARKSHQVALLIDADLFMARFDQTSQIVIPNWPLFF
jgi:hypothetical protein